MGCPVHLRDSPRCLNLPASGGSHCPAQATRVKFTLICAWPKMGWSLKERDATKPSCLFSPEDKSPTIAQATGRKQTQIQRRESLAGAGWSILAKQTLPLAFVPAFVRSPLFSLNGVLASSLHRPSEQPCGARLAASGNMRSQKGLTPPRTLALLSARNPTASRPLVTSEGLFVIGKNTLAGGRRSAKGCRKARGGQSRACRRL